MRWFYEESGADLMASYNRSRHAYEAFAAPDDTEIEEEQAVGEFHELTADGSPRDGLAQSSQGRMCSRTSMRPAE